MRAAFVGLSLFVVGCGSGTIIADDIAMPTDAGDASDATTSDATAVDAADASTDAPFSCGSQTCQPNELCFKPCSGGISQCMPTGDAGTCPPGTHTDIMCTSQSSNTPCAPDPPPPYCSTSGCQTGLFWTQSGHDCIQMCQ